MLSAFATCDFVCLWAEVSIELPVEVAINLWIIIIFSFFLNSGSCRFDCVPSFRCFSRGILLSFCSSFVSKQGSFFHLYTISYFSIVELLNKMAIAFCLCSSMLFILLVSHAWIQNNDLVLVNNLLTIKGCFSLFLFSLCLWEIGLFVMEQNWKICLWTLKNWTCIK